MAKGENEEVRAGEVGGGWRYEGRANEVIEGVVRKTETPSAPVVSKICWIAVI